MSASLPAASPPAISGLILAGGKGSRMGGVDKGLQLLQGRPLLRWVLDGLFPQVSETLISANLEPGHHDDYAPFGARILRDEITRAGPLGGIHAGLQAARHELLATVPCDAPFLPADLVARLFRSLDDSQADIAVARTADGRQPVFALFRRSTTYPALNVYLRLGGRKADGWYAGLRLVEPAFADAAAFSNINTPEALATLEAKTAPGTQPACSRR